VQNNWSAAGREFDQAGETSLRDLARAEAERPRTATKQLDLAEQWWAWADKSEPPLEYLTVERALAWSMLADSHGAKGAKAALTQHKQALLQQRRTTNLAFAPRHPPDAIKVGNSWYKFYKWPVNWKTAVQMCEEVGGSLPSIDSPDKNQALAQLLVTLAGSGTTKPECWLGLTDESKEGEWRWQNGMVLGSSSYNNWGDKEPNNLGGNENYAKLEIITTGGVLSNRWYDDDAETACAVFCEWQQ
jgi:hypothetical protein